MWLKTFWFLAGLWNISIGTFGWCRVAGLDEKMRRDTFTRFNVALAGIFYILVGLYPKAFEWVTLIGAILKFGCAFIVFYEEKNCRFPLPFLSYIMVGDILWALGFLLFYFQFFPY
jgi:hypothetical protein